MSPITLDHWLVRLVLECALFFVAFMYLGAPFIIYLTHKVSTHPTFQVVNPGDPGVPEEAAAFLEDSIAALRPLGFAPRAMLYQDDFAPQTAMWLTYFENEAALDFAMAVVAYGKAQEIWKLKAKYVEYVSKFGEASITTNNSPVMSLFAEVPQRLVTSLPAIADAPHLYFLHKGIVERFAGPGPKSRPAEKGPIEILISAMIRSLEEQVGTGYYRRDEVLDKFRPTLLGALLMTWKSLWPWKRLRHAARDRRAAEIERELVGTV